MNILILTGRFGMGHYSAAEALQEEINLNYKHVNVKVIDIIDCIFPNLNNKIYGLFEIIVTRHSLLYNAYSGFMDKKVNMPMKKSIANKISKLIDDNSPNLVLSTLPIASQMISIYKQITGSRIPLYTYITDISSHEEWISKHTNFYFVGSKESKKNLVQKGVNCNKIIVSGIPVRKSFRLEDIKLDKENEKFEILIMGGGLGLVPSVDEVLKKLSQNNNIHVTIITGKNNRLKEEIKNNYQNVEVVGYTKEVHYYMKKADLLITKSGGITTFEAINSKTPMFIIKPFLKQEVGNAQFIASENLGRVVWYDDTDIANDIISFISNERFIQTIKENMSRMKSQWSTICPLKIYHMEGEIIC